MREDKNIYSMTTISQKEMRLRRKNILIICCLVLLFIILILIMIKTGGNIKKQKQAQKYANQVLQYQEKQKQKQEEEQKKEEQKRKEKLPEVTEKGKENIKSIYHSDTKRAFLTFDDGPSTVTSQILQTLNEKGVKATFFVLGSNAEHMPNMVKQMYEQGNYIANHGYSHIYSSIYASPETVLEEYNKTNDIIKNAIGEPEFNSHLFRFPGGLAGGKYADIKKQAKEILNQNDIYNVDWNCLTGDSETTNPTPEYVLKRLEETASGKNSLIVLMHDAQVKHVTADMLPQIIDYLASQGYEFKTFYDVYEK